MYNATYLINGSFIFQKRRGPSEGARYLRIGLYLKNLGILGVLLALGVLTSGCRQASATLAPAVPPTVAVAPVAKSEAARELHLSGSLSAERSIALSFATIGIVERVTVREGEAVKKGQVLATVAQRGFQDALGIAEAKAKQAEDAYQRLMPFYYK
jgi:multidrug efflux pump subunit AcrA (membrane-fusion protein)